VLWMGIAVSVYIWLAQEIYRLYAAAYDALGFRTLAEVVSSGHTPGA